MAFPELLLGWFLVLWAPALPEPCWLPSLQLLSCLSSIMILRIGTFRGCHLAHAPPRGAFVMSHLPSPLHPQFEHFTIFMARHAAGNFTRIHPQSAWFGGCVHSSSAQSLPFLQRSLVSGTLSSAGQNSGDRRSQLFKCCFHSASEKITLSFLFQSHEMKTLGKGDRGKHLVFFLLLLLFHLVLETRPCGYSQDEIYSPVPCQLLTASDSPVSFTAAVNSHTLLSVGLHPNLLGQCLTAELLSHACSLSLSQWIFN